MDQVFPRRSLLRWKESLQLFEVVRSTGNHWHTIGYPVHGCIHLIPEEALFLVESNLAAYTLNQTDYEESTPNLVSFILEEGLLSNANILRTYLGLKKLGYVLWRPDNIYLTNLQDIDLTGDYVVFMPNSTFQKKSPTGYVGTISLENSDASYLSQVDKTRLISINDEIGHLFIQLTDVTADIMSRL